MKHDKGHLKKIIAPVIVTFIVSFYWLGIFAAAVLSVDASIALKLIGAAIPAAGVALIFYVLKRRIDEIEGGEEDDISKY